MAHRIVLVVVLVPLAVVIVALAVANRAPVAFTIDPFNPGSPALTVHWPLFVYLFAATALGLIVGGLVTWVRQGRYRRMARERGREAAQLRRGAAGSGPAPQLPPVT